MLCNKTVYLSILVHYLGGNDSMTSLVTPPPIIKSNIFPPLKIIIIVVWMKCLYSLGSCALCKTDM